MQSRSQTCAKACTRCFSRSIQACCAKDACSFGGEVWRCAEDGRSASSQRGEIGRSGFSYTFPATVGKLGFETTPFTTADG